ncbi:hypothetical protein GGR57DRAFT_228303 [Xylariaceae sp. FL1272]|nr:hypothetical protein GGR57DRAFT_228303 [Xylariaceae sp. FL1272]
MPLMSRKREYGHHDGALIIEDTYDDVVGRTMTPNSFLRRFLRVLMVFGYCKFIVLRQTKSMTLFETADSSDNYFLILCCNQQQTLDSSMEGRTQRPHVQPKPSHGSADSVSYVTTLRNRRLHDEEDSRVDYGSFCGIFMGKTGLCIEWRIGIYQAFSRMVKVFILGSLFFNGLGLSFSLQSFFILSLTGSLQVH